MPFLDSSPFLCDWKTGQYLAQALLTMRWQDESASDSIDNPAENGFCCSPRAVPLSQFVHRDRLSSSVWVIKIVGSEGFIDGVEEKLANTLAIVVALSQGNKIVHKHVDVGCGLCWRRQAGVTDVRDGCFGEQRK